MTSKTAVLPMPAEGLDQDRFRGVGPRFAGAILMLVASLVLLGVCTGAKVPGARGGPPGNDSGLFLRVVDDLRRGEPYYEAVTQEQRRLHYPLRPAITVRLPTLAWAMAKLPDAPARILSVRALALATFLAWLWRLRAQTRRPVSFGLATLVLAGAHAPALIPFGYTLHELWAGELLALALAIYSPARWGFSVAIALVALSIRELAAPFFLAMGVLAWRDRRRLEASAWAAALILFAGVVLVHAGQLQPHIRPEDLASPGWLGLSGWPFVLLQMKWNALLMTNPDWVAAALAPLAFLGLIASTGRIADRLLLTVAGYTCAFLVAGRPDNAYWGLVTAPLWPIGLYFTVDAILNLLRQVRFLPPGPLRLTRQA